MLNQVRQLCNLLLALVNHKDWLLSRREEFLYYQVKLFLDVFDELLFLGLQKLQLFADGLLELNDFRRYLFVQIFEFQILNVVGFVHFRWWYADKHQVVVEHLDMLSGYRGALLLELKGLLVRSDELTQNPAGQRDLLVVALKFLVCLFVHPFELLRSLA